MRNDELAAIFVCSAGAFITALLVRQRMRIADRRLRVVEAAMQHPALDEATRAALRDALRRVAEQRGVVWHAMRLLVSAKFWSTASFAIGWFLFIVCGGTWLFAHLGSDEIGYVAFRPRNEMMVGAAVGMALMTLPRAMQELRGRDARLAER